MSSMPSIPGEHLEVDLGKKQIRFYDPLADDEQRVKRINRVLKMANLGEDDRTPKPEERTVDDDTLVTLLHELHRMKEAGCVSVVGNGRFPTLQEIEAAPGYELFDPGSQSQSKPRYKKDRDAHIDKIETAHRT